MATPTFLTGTTGARPGNRPIHKAANGSYYHVFINTTAVTVYKAPSPTGPWTSAATESYTQPTQGFEQIINSSISEDGLRIGFTILISDGFSNGRPRCFSFNTATDSLADASNSNTLFGTSNLHFFESTTCTGNTELHALVSQGNSQQNRMYGLHKAHGGSTSNGFSIATTSSVNFYGFAGFYDEARDITNLSTLRDSQLDSYPGPAIWTLPGFLSGTTSTTRTLGSVSGQGIEIGQPQSNMIPYTVDPYPPDGFPAAETGIVVYQLAPSSGFTHMLAQYSDLEIPGQGIRYSERFSIDLGVAGKTTMGGEKGELTLVKRGSDLFLFYIGTDNAIYWTVRNGQGSFASPVLLHQGTDLSGLGGEYHSNSGDFAGLTFREGTSTYALAVDLNASPVWNTGIPSSEAFGTAQINQRVAQDIAVPSENLYRQDFASGDTFADSKWHLNPPPVGTLNRSYPLEGPSGERVVQFSDARVWYINTGDYIPFDHDILYAVGGRIRQKVLGPPGNRGAHIGLVGRDNNGNPVSTAGGNNFFSNHWFAILDYPLSDKLGVWQHFQGYMKGVGEPAGGVHNDVEDPGTMHPNTTSGVMLSFLGNNNNDDGNGAYQAYEFWVSRMGAVTGRPTITTFNQIGATSIPSAEGFGTAKINRNAQPVSIASAEAFGQVIVTKPIEPVGIFPAEAFGSPTLGLTLRDVSAGSQGEVGTAKLNLRADPGAIPSEEAVPEVSVNQGQALIDVPSIQGGESFGNTLVTAGGVILNPTGIPSQEAIPTATLGLSYEITASGIPSAEAFGQPAFQSTLRVSSITSGEAFGTAKLNLTLSLPPVQDGEQVGPARINTVTQDPILLGEIL